MTNSVGIDAAQNGRRGLLDVKRDKNLDDRIFEGFEVKPAHSKQPVFSYQIALSEKMKSIADGTFFGGWYRINFH